MPTTDLTPHMHREPLNHSWNETLLQKLTSPPSWPPPFLRKIIGMAGHTPPYLPQSGEPTPYQIRYRPAYPAFSQGIMTPCRQQRLDAWNACDR